MATVNPSNVLDLQLLEILGISREQVVSMAIICEVGKPIQVELERYIERPPRTTTETETIHYTIKRKEPHDEL